MQSGESKVKKIEEILIKVQESRNLKDIYKKIVDKEIEIADLDSSLDALNHERKLITQDTLVKYRSFREESSSSHAVATMAGGSVASMGFVTAMLSGATLLTMGTFALGGAALGAGAIALNGYIKNNWLSPRNIEYQDVPFVEAKPVFSGGKFVVLESSPERGIYRACFYPEVVADTNLTVEIWVNTKQLPWNAKRIVEIDKSLEINQQLLKTKKDELAALNSEKELLVKKEALREQAAKQARYATLFKARESLVTEVVSSDQLAKPTI